jgi:hypothetical protein
MDSTTKQIFARVLAVNVCMDVVCLKVLISRLCINGKIIPENHGIYSVHLFTVKVQDKDGLRPEDIAKAIPGEDIIIHLEGNTVQAIKTEKVYADLHTVATELWQEYTQEKK